jgi:hypothetical protein
VSLNEKSDQREYPGVQAQAGGADLAWVALISGAIFIWAHWPAFTNPFVINDDVRQQIFWMQRWLDPGLFKGDLLSDYARHYVPWGVQGLYWLASWLMSPLYFSKLLPGALFVFLAACLFKIGGKLGDRTLAWVTVSLYWLMPFFLDNLAGGLARGFAAPLLALFLLCWLNRQPRGMVAALLLMALFIPYVFLVAAAAAALAWLAHRAGWVSPPPVPARPAHWLALAVGFGLVALMSLSFDRAGFGPLVSAAEMAHRAEFTSRGRFAILPVPSLWWELLIPWQDLAPFRDAGPVAGVTFCLVAVTLALTGACRVDWRALRDRLQPLGWLGLSSVLLYFLARLFLLKMFIPDRYVVYTFNLFYCLFLAVCLTAALKINRWPRNLALLSLVLAATLGGLRLQGVGLKDYSAYQALYAALARTPKDALIAGHPNLMDTVPTFAQRRAFATYELAHPWSRGYWQQLRPRLDDFFRAYYAATPQEVLAFCRKYRISFLVVDDRHFRPDFLAGGVFFFPMEQRVPPNFGRSRFERIDAPFFAPFDAEIRRQVAGRHQFALLSWSLSSPVVLDHHLRLLDLRPWLSKNPPVAGFSQGKPGGGLVEDHREQAN